MEALKDKTAVVTGAASGIGFALAKRFLDEGMNVAMADIDADALGEAEQSLGAGDRTLVVTTDVSKADQVEEFAQRTEERFGSVHLLCNNAGVFSGGLSWEAPVAEYDWLMGVNVYGVVHGVRSFVPRMIAHGEPGRVVNTASMAGVTTLPYTTIYHMTKHAVVAFSECLYHELNLSGAKIGVSVLCPEMVSTQIHRAARNQPQAVTDALAASPMAPERAIVAEAITATVNQGVPPSEMADRVVRAVHEDRFYILSEEEWRDCANTRLDDVRAGRNPTFAPPQV